MKITIHLRLGLILLPIIPLAAFIFVSIGQFQTIRNNFSIFDNQEINSLYISEASDLILALQLERGISALLVSGDDKKAELDKNRVSVDERMKHIEQMFFSTSFFEKGETLYAEYQEGVAKIRNEVDSGTLSYTDVMSSYSGIINKLFELNTLAAKEKTTGGIGKRLSSLNILQDSQEASSRLCGYLCSIIFVDKSISDDLSKNLLKYYDSMDMNLNSRGVILSSDSLELRNNIISSEAWDDIYNVVNDIALKHKSGDYGINSSLLKNDLSTVTNKIHEILEAELKVILTLNNKLEDKIVFAYYSQLGVLVGSSLIVIVLSFFIILNITKRIGFVSRRLDEMSSGRSDLTVSINAGVKDDIGKLINVFNKYVLSLKQMVSKIQHSAIGLTELGRELGVHMGETEEAKSYIADNLELVRQNVDAQVQGMDRLVQGIDIFSDSVDGLVVAVDEQVTAVTESSASIEEMIANIQTVTSNLDHTTGLINDLESESKNGSGLINQVASEIVQVAEQSAELQEANELIAGIADQTNLLAMNAAIEAAHAGEAGKGFSVVADEIRHLAETSSEQSMVISQNIKSITDAISSVVESTGKSEKSFAVIVDMVKNVSMLQEGIRGAMVEQGYGSTEILTALSTLRDSTNKVNDASEVMKSTGGKMGSEIKEFKSANDHLLESVETMSSSVKQIEAVIKNISGLVKQNEGYVDDLNEKTNSFILK